MRIVGSGGVGGGAGLFDVRVAALRTAAGQVHGDAVDAYHAVDTVQGAADAAGGACGGPLLTAALGRLSQVLGTDGGQLHQALDAAGSRLSTNADTYAGADQDAGSALAGTFTGLAGGPLLGVAAP